MYKEFYETIYKLKWDIATEHNLDNLPDLMSRLQNYLNILKDLDLEEYYYKYFENKDKLRQQQIDYEMSYVIMH